MDMKRCFLYLSMITALALAGCNGDGGKRMITLPTPAMTERAEGISDAIEGIKGITGRIPSSTPLPIGNGFPDAVDVDRGDEGDPIFTLRDEKVSKTFGGPTIYSYDAFTDPEYKKAMGVTTPEIDGWYGETLTRSTDTTGTDLVTLYTDIGTPKLEVTSGDSGLDISTIPHRVTLGGVGPIDLMHDNTDTFIGKFGGEDGTFTCTATGGCAVGLVTGSTNIAASISGTWSFASTEMFENNDYLVFGYWLNENERGINRFLFNPIFDGYNRYDTDAFEDLVDSTSFSEADSKATYTGPAAGRYVEKTIRLLDNDVLDTEYATEGQFTAEASFTAYFGESDDINGDLHNTITGGITNFKDADEKDLNFEIDFGSVSLVDALDDALNDRARYISYESKSIKASHGETPSNGGSWSFGLYGTSEDSNGDLIIPNGIAGAFQANFNNGNVAGAFGARKNPTGNLTNN